MPGQGQLTKSISALKGKGLEGGGPLKGQQDTFTWYARDHAVLPLLGWLPLESTKIPLACLSGELDCPPRNPSLTQQLGTSRLFSQGSISQPTSEANSWVGSCVWTHISSSCSQCPKRNSSQQNTPHLPMLTTNNVFFLVFPENHRHGHFWNRFLLLSMPLTPIQGVLKGNSWYLFCFLKPLSIVPLSTTWWKHQHFLVHAPAEGHLGCF